MQLSIRHWIAGALLKWEPGYRPSRYQLDYKALGPSSHFHGANHTVFLPRKFTGINAITTIEGRPLRCATLSQRSYYLHHRSYHRWSQWMEYDSRHISSASKSKCNCSGGCEGLVWYAFMHVVMPRVYYHWHVGHRIVAHIDCIKPLRLIACPTTCRVVSSVPSSVLRNSLIFGLPRRILNLRWDMIRLAVCRSAARPTT